MVEVEVEVGIEAEGLLDLGEVDGIEVDVEVGEVEVGVEVDEVGVDVEVVDEVEAGGALLKMHSLLNQRHTIPLFSSEVNEVKIFLSNKPKK